MKRVSTWVFVAVLCMHGVGLYATEGEGDRNGKRAFLPITQDVVKAKEMARAYHKPLALVFTGSDWCPYSRKLLEKIIGSEDFAQEVKNSFVFTHIDFPELRTRLDLSKVEENYRLKEELQVKEFPLIVLFDEELHEIARMGFSGHTSSEYGRQLVEALKKYEAIKKTLESKSALGFADVRQCYTEARELGSPFLIDKALSLGLKQDKDCFFHLEKYKRSQGKEREEWKQKILVLNRDKKNSVGLHLAILEYQERQDSHQKNALEPLLEYTKELGPQHAESVEDWKVHMLIAQQLALEGEIAKALDHAKLSLELSPDEHRYEVEHSIKILSADLTRPTSLHTSHT